ncbi:uncharacterized protein LOC118271020 [Spodoptera frugiperda]|uniref:Uncharacterized protein LOC118271020 n=1 Tax=Spodoptera frugiperda TaxID=7108 RepID=A0A9R0DQB8_SPOFR|nr:uncharacterized protein LOC118271020 [Spodoptera frugiperda]
MAQYKFEGEFSNINERQLQFVNEVIEKQNLQVEKVIFNRMGKAGDNFISDVKRIVVEAKEGKLNMIIKTAPAMEVLRSSLNTDLMFKNEHVMYTEVLPKLLALQKEAGVPEGEHLRFAKCYGSLDEAPNEVILLEDLNEADFKMLNKFDPLPENCLRSILKNFATLHSLAFVLRHKEPETYDLFNSKLKNNWEPKYDDPDFNLQFKMFSKVNSQILDEDYQKEILNNMLTDVSKEMEKLMGDRYSKYAVFQQGDAWTNNFMFRFEDGELRESVMIDYQASASISPASDLLFMFFNCTDHETRSKNFIAWIDYYHLELDKSLSYFGLKADDVYPRDQLDADLKRYGKISFAIIILFTNILMRDQSEAGKLLEALQNGGIKDAMEEMGKRKMNKETAERARNRIVGLIDSYIQFGLLNQNEIIIYNLASKHSIMAQYKFEGDFENITEPQLEFINKVVQEQDLDVNKVVFQPVGKPGDNFTSNVKRICIEGNNGNMNMIIKIAPSGETQRMTFMTEIVFKNEHLMYVVILPKLVSLQKEAGVPEDELLRFAKCYGSFNEAPNEIIILEDLCESDYVMLDKFESLSDECMKGVLKSFAIFHSLSYALKYKEPDTFEYYKSQLFDVWSLMAENPVFKTHNEVFVMAVQALLEEEDHKNIVKTKLAEVFNLLTKLNKWEQNNKHSVIQQGDAWTNNIMFKIGEDKVQTVMIDFQGSKNNNPVADLLYVIFNCTDHETRVKHFYDWIDYYHAELEKSLSNFGLKANYVYSRDQLDADVKRYGKVMFGMSVMLANLLMRDTKEASELMEAMKTTADMKELMESMGSQVLQHETIIRARKKIVDLIASFSEFGLF